MVELCLDVFWLWFDLFFAYTSVGCVCSACAQISSNMFVQFVFKIRLGRCVLVVCKFVQVVLQFIQSVPMCSGWVWSVWCLNVFRLNFVWSNCV